MEIEFIKEGILEETLPFFPTTVKRASTWHEMEKMDDIEDFNVLRLLFPKDFVLVYKASQSMITKEMEKPEYYYVSEAIPGRTGVATPDVLCFSFFHDKGRLVIGESLINTLIELGADKERIKQYSNQDIEVDAKKICGIGGRIINGKYTFEVGMIIVIKDDLIFRDVLPDDEYYRVKYYDGEPDHYRLPCTGIINEFPFINKDIFVEKFMENVKVLVDSINTPNELNNGIMPLKPYAE